MNAIVIAKDAWQALGAGRVVADPAAWKKKQVSVNQVAAALGTLLVLAKALGYDLHMDDPTKMYVAGGLYGIVNWLLTVITTDKIGVMGQRHVPVVAGDGATGGPPAGGQGPLDTPVGGGAAVAVPADPVRDGPKTSDPTEGSVLG